MNFERDFPVPKHGNGDSLNFVPHGMPIPRESEAGCNKDSWTTMAEENGDTTEGTLLQRNGIFERVKDWKPATPGSSIPHRNGIEQSKNSWTPVTPEKLINERPNATPVGMQEKQSETDNWQDLIGMYTDLLKEETVDSDTLKRNLNTSPDQKQGATSIPYFKADPANWKCNHLASIVCSKSINEAQNNGAHFSNRPLFQVELNTSKKSTSITLGTQQTQKFSFISSGHTSKDGAASSTVTDSLPFAPITPAKHNDEQRIGDSPPSAVSTTQKEHIVPKDRDEQGIDLSKTPQQKTPKRRKKTPPASD